VAASRRKPFWTVDAETDPFKVGRVPQPFIWGLYGGPNEDDYYEFDTARELVRFLESKEHLVYAHNGGKFDYHYMRPWINTGEPISIIAGRLAKFRIGVCEFRDSMNILPVPLAHFKKDEVDYSIFEPEERDKPHNRETIRKYLRSDCSYLYELITEHRKENGVALTQAGASMRAWSKQSHIKPPRQTAARYQQYKPYYYGGRVQCFASGTEKRRFKVIDINSAYPKAMLSEHPFSVAATHQKRLPPDGELHKCLITLKCVARGCFPFRTGDDPTKGDLYFPYDERTIRRYHVTGYEFITALKLDAISQIHIEDVHYFEQGVKFEEFITSNWDRRAAAKKAGNKALDIIVKLLMNSLYGKFASDYAKYREYYLAHVDDLLRYLNPAADNWRKLNTGRGEPFMIDTDWGDERRLICRPIPEDKHRFYNIATAASITGYVRAMLFEALQTVSDPLYCDTDSIACVGTGGLALGDGLGEWKVEGEFDEYAIAGKKMYAFHKDGMPRYNDAGKFELDHRGDYVHFKVACKGVDLNPDQIAAAAGGKTVLYSPEAPTYSVKKQGPKFIDRNVKLTARDIRIVPEEV
jgi:hypothetical protein